MQLVANFISPNTFATCKQALYMTENRTFPILTPTHPSKIGAENQMLQIAVSDANSSSSFPAIIGFLFVLSIMLGLTASYIFLIFSPIMLLLLIGFLPRAKQAQSRPVQGHGETIYTHFGQEIAFDESAIYIYSDFPHEEKEFLYKEIQEIKLYFLGITEKNAESASTIRIIRQGKNHDYAFWIDSEGSRMRLINVLKRLYKKEVRLIEYIEGRKTYLLGLVSEREIDAKIQSLIDEIGEADAEN